MKTFLMIIGVIACIIHVISVWNFFQHGARMLFNGPSKEGFQSMGIAIGVAAVAVGIALGAFYLGDPVVAPSSTVPPR